MLGCVDDSVNDMCEVVAVSSVAIVGLEADSTGAAMSTVLPYPRDVWRNVATNPLLPAGSLARPTYNSFFEISPSNAGAHTPWVFDYVMGNGVNVA